MITTIVFVEQRNPGQDPPEGDWGFSDGQIPPIGAHLRVTDKYLDERLHGLYEVVDQEWLITERGCGHVRLFVR